MVADYRQRSVGELHEALQQLLALKHVTDAEIAKIAAAAEDLGLHTDDGATSMGAWLVEAGRLSATTANTYVRVGHALAQLPHLAKAFSEGRLTLDQVRPAVRFVTPELDEEMANRLPGWSVRQIEQAARDAQIRTPKDANQAHERRHLTFRDDPDAGGGHITAFLDAERYQAAKAELRRRAEAAPIDPATGDRDTWAHRLADAFSDVIGTAGADRDPRDPAVVVHVDADVLDGTTEGNGHIDLTPIARETVLRFLCATNLEFVVEADDGTKAIGIDRLSQRIPRAIRRQIIHRDGRCRFPGCDRPIRHIHHVIHWDPKRSKGKTNDDNLIGLCWNHHRLVHEGGWHARGDPRTTITFEGPHRQRLTSHPDGLSNQIRRRLFE